MLLTLPIRSYQAVLGKYAAALVLYGLFLLCSLPIPLMLEVLGTPDRGLILSGYLGLVCFGALFLAIGSFLSALSRDQIVAFVSTTAIGFALVLTGNERVVAILDGVFPAVGLGTFLGDTVSVIPRYDTFVRGVIVLSTLSYFVLLSALALWTCSAVLDRVRT